MPHWIALLPPAQDAKPRPSCDAAGTSAAAPTGAEPDGLAQAVQALGGVECLPAKQLGWWALQFSPRVALLADGLVLEIEASERLFGGIDALLSRIPCGALERGTSIWAHGPTPLAAIALARARAPLLDHQAGKDLKRLTQALDPLPLCALPAATAHQSTLLRLGCSTLGHLRQLPRGGITRRFGAPLLDQLDQAYGLRPTPLEWLQLPAVFDARMELSHASERLEASLGVLQHLLKLLCAWLDGHMAATSSLHLYWQHERRMYQEGSAWQSLQIRLSRPSSDPHHLRALLQEHLQHLSWSAPICEWRLRVDEMIACATVSASLFGNVMHADGAATADATTDAAALQEQRLAWIDLLDRLAARLGEDCVRQGQLHSDHRIEHSQRWQSPRLRAALRAAGKAIRLEPSRFPQPGWILSPALPLATQHDANSGALRPCYQGPLRLLAGPHRLETGWWDDSQDAQWLTRDHFLASSPHAGLLWIFRVRQASAQPNKIWYLQGIFA